MMRIEIVSTGDEVITGSIDDTNASFLSQELAECGLEVNRRHTTGDDLNEIEAVFTEISQRKAIVLVTGGLGPTNDDLTTLAVSHVANVPLCLHTEWLEHIKALFEHRGRIMTESNKKQAMLPLGCHIIDNPHGTACGFLIKMGKATFIFAPGVPKELKAMWHDSIKDLVLSTIISESLPRMTTSKYTLMGIGESNLADIIKHLDLPEGIIFGDRAVHPLIELKLISRNVAPAIINSTYDLVHQLLRRYIICNGIYDPITHLEHQHITLPKLHIVDLVCQGTLASELQKLNVKIISSHVFSLEPSLDKLDEASLTLFKQSEQLLKVQQPESNSIYLMPSSMYAKLQEQPLIQESYTPQSFSYTLCFNLNCTDQDLPRHIQGSIRFNFTQAKPDYFQSQRHRNYLSVLCITELTKLLSNENLVLPDDCSVELLSFEDSKSTNFYLGLQQPEDMPKLISIIKEQLIKLK